MRNNYMLKNCPFCGGRPDVRYNQTVGITYSADIICRNCNLKLHAWGFNKNDLDREITAKWNKRK